MVFSSLERYITFVKGSSYVHVAIIVMHAAANTIVMFTTMNIVTELQDVSRP